MRSRNQANAELEQIKDAQDPAEEFVREHIRRYVLGKYLLDENTPGTELFSKLTELSLANSAKISPELVKEFDTAQSCDGATSAMAKKVLLGRSIEKGLDVTLDAARFAKVKTLDDFTELVWTALLDKDA